MWKAEILGELFATYLAPRLVSREVETAEPSVYINTKHDCNAYVSINLPMLCILGKKRESGL